MAEHGRTNQDKQSDLEHKHRKRPQESQSSFEKSHALDTGQSSQLETLFVPRMDEHIAVLSSIPFSAQRHEFIMRLNRTYGLRYVQRLMESMRVQAKLTVSDPNDAYEQEADRVAEEVTRSINNPIQRQTPDEEEELQMQEEEEELQTKPLNYIQKQEEEEEEELQTKPFNSIQKQDEEEELQAQLTENEPLSVSNDLETRINSSRGSGSSLSEEVRNPMEQVFNADFSGVRTHTDSEADKLNMELSAKAFTTGQDIFFREGEYSPGSDSGRKLIAHELTHVVQQSTGRVPRKTNPKSLQPSQNIKTKEFQPEEKQRHEDFQANEMVSQTPSIQRELSSSEDYAEMKVRAGPGRKKTYGMLSVANYKKKIEEYSRLKYASGGEVGGWVKAGKILAYLRKRFEELEKAGADYWKGGLAAKREYFDPIKMNLYKEIEYTIAASKNLGAVLPAGEIPEVTAASSADEASVLWGHFSDERDKAAMRKIWSTGDVGLHGRILQVLGGATSKVRLSSLNYVLEFLDAEHRQGLFTKARDWSVDETVDPFFTWLESHLPVAVQQTEYLDIGSQALKETHLGFKGGQIYKGGDKLTTSEGGDAIVMSSGEFYSAKKGAQAGGGGRIIQHSTFLAGLPAESAGMITTSEGKLTKLENYSGHYAPKTEHLVKMVVAFLARGIVMGEDVTVRDHERLEREDAAAGKPLLEQGTYQGAASFLERVKGV